MEQEKAHNREAAVQRDIKWKQWGKPKKKKKKKLGQNPK